MHYEPDTHHSCVGHTHPHRLSAIDLHEGACGGEVCWSGLKHRVHWKQNTAKKVHRHTYHETARAHTDTPTPGMTAHEGVCTQSAAACVTKHQRVSTRHCHSHTTQAAAVAVSCSNQPAGAHSQRKVKESKHRSGAHTRTATALLTSTKPCSTPCTHTRGNPPPQARTPARPTQEHTHP
jgi:hypothetical protein